MFGRSFRPSPSALRPFSGGSSASVAYVKRIRGVVGSALYAFYPLTEASGGTANEVVNKYNGTAIGLDWNNTPGPYGVGAPLFDGANDYIDLPAGARTAFNGNTGTFGCYAKVYNAGVWSDATTRRFFYAYTDANNNVRVSKSATANTINNARTATSNFATNDYGAVTATDWFSFVSTWNNGGVGLTSYLNGVAIAPTAQANAYAGAVTRFTIGSTDTTPTNVFYGWLQYCWFASRDLSAAEVLAVI